MNTTIPLRQMIFQNYEQSRRLMPSKGQMDMLRRVKQNGEISSSEYSRLYGCSVQSASGRLNKLFHKGWLVKASRQDPTGGYFYEYRLVPGVAP